VLIIYFLLLLAIGVMQLSTYKNTGCNILKGGPIEEAQLLLDEHVVKTQNMLASPFAAPFEKHLNKWLNAVNLNYLA
jgi:dynein heavy chain